MIKTPSPAFGSVGHEADRFDDREMVVTQITQHSVLVLSGHRNPVAFSAYTRSSKRTKRTT